MTSWASSGTICGLRTAPSYPGTDQVISGLPGDPGQCVNAKSDQRAQGGLPGEVPCPVRTRAFPGQPPSEPGVRLSAHRALRRLRRSRDRGHVDVVMALCADDERLEPHPCHEGCPRGLARPGPAEVRERGDLVDGHRGAVLA